MPDAGTEAKAWKMCQVAADVTCKQKGNKASMRKVGIKNISGTGGRDDEARCGNQHHGRQQTWRRGNVQQRQMGSPNELRG